MPSSTLLVRLLPEHRPDSSAVSAIAGIAGVIVVAVLAMAGLPQASRAARAVDPAIVTVHSVARPKGLMVTSGGWAYCEQVRALARRTGYTLLCGRTRTTATPGRAPGRAPPRLGQPGVPRESGAEGSRGSSPGWRRARLIGVSYSGFGLRRSLRITRSCIPTG